MPLTKHQLRQALDVAWKDRNYRTTLRTAHAQKVHVCYQCGNELPNHCFWFPVPEDTTLPAGPGRRSTRVWCCSQECLSAGLVRAGLA